MQEHVGIPDTSKLPNVSKDNEHSYKNYSTHYFQQLLAYDTSVHKIQRKVFLEMYVNLKKSNTIVCFGNDGEVLGYVCLVQVGGDAYLLAPLLCDSDNIACNLAIDALKRLPKGASLTVYIEDSKASFKYLITQIGLEPGLTFPRMQTSNFLISNPIDKIYASNNLRTVII